MARIKRVFGSHSEVTHIWAQQTQDEGRAGNIFFTGRDIYSYGMHYLAARIHTIKGKQVALVRSDTYGPATSKHLCEIRNALRGLMPYYRVTDVTDLKAAMGELDIHAQNGLKTVLSRMKVESEESIKWEFECIHSNFKEANELRKLLGRVEKWPTKKQLDIVQAHLEKRLKRYRELNTPEMIAIKEAKKQKSQAIEQAKQVERQKEQIHRFRSGEYSGNLNLPYEYLRINGDQIETSRGAFVPLNEAVQLFVAIKAGKNVTGQAIGNFTVTSTLELPDGDTLVHIGCHRILMSEAAKLMCKPLHLLQGGAA